MILVSWPNHESLEENAITKSMLDASSPNDDMWKKFLTPPSSPRSMGESSESEEDCSSDTRKQLQYVCDNLDSNFELTSSRCSSLNLRSNLISDCMWSGEGKNSTNKEDVCLFSVTRKLSLDSVEDLYPTPCPSPRADDTETEIPDYHTNSGCVDPTTVFPLPVATETPDDTDEEIDVVTVESTKCANPAKRKRPLSIVIAKIETNRTTTKLKTDRHKKTIFIDDLNPKEKRSVHNVLERKRRIDLKISFEKLRDCVPDLEREEKTPKVVVLKKASLHLQDLQVQEEKLEEEKIILQLKNEELKNRLKSFLI